MQMDVCMQNIKQLIWDDRFSQLEVCSKDWSLSARFKMIGIGVGRDDESTIQVNTLLYSICQVCVSVCRKDCR